MITTDLQTRRGAILRLATFFTGINLASFPLAHGKNSKKGEQISPYYLPPADPLQPGPGGIDIRTLIHSTQTNRQFSCVETAVASRQMGPAPHLHKNLDEIMLVIEGTATVVVGKEVSEIAAGGWHIRPRGIEHTFCNSSEKTLRFVDMYFNQNFEDYLEELFHQIIPEMQKNNLTPGSAAIQQRMAELDKKFGVIMFPEKRQPIIDAYRLNS